MSCAASLPSSGGELTGGTFYDLVVENPGSDPANARGNVPDCAVKRYQKHKKEGSRQSGRKGWDGNMFLPGVPALERLLP